jgi:hypothetical protein
VQVRRKPFTNDVVDIGNAVDVEDSNQSEYPKGTAHLVQENRFVYALPIVRMDLGIEQRDLYFKTRTRRLLRRNRELEFG